MVDSGQEVTVTSMRRSDGTSFRLLSADAVASESVAVTVVISPAMGMPAGYYDRFLAELATAGLHGIAYEQRGHEEGEQPAGWRRNFGYRELIDDLSTVVAEARRRHPGTRVVVLGHSLGGQVAVAAAGTEPGLYDGLVLMASSTPYWRSWSRKMLVAGVAFPVIASVLGHFPGDRLKFAGRESRGLMRDWGRLALTGRLPHGEAGLADVDVPVLAFSIEGDWLGVPSAVDALCAKFPQVTPTRVHVDEGGIDHFKWARRPQSVLPALRAWVETAVLSTSQSTER